MFLLQWTIDWITKHASAVTKSGRYTIDEDHLHRWTAKFHKTHDGTDVISKDPKRHTVQFDSLADALRACQRHADDLANKSSGSSGRLTTTTPLPSPP